MGKNASDIENVLSKTPQDVRVQIKIISTFKWHFFKTNITGGVLNTDGIRGR